MAELNGKVALVTGAGQGVGLGIAQALAQAGAAVALAGRTLEKVEAAAASIRENGGKAIALACDVKSAADLERIVANTVSTFGGLDMRGLVRSIFWSTMRRKCRSESSMTSATRRFWRASNPARSPPSG